MSKTAGLMMIFCALLFSGCTTIGPSSIAKDRFDYTGAIAESWKKMMLLNIVKVRYGDTPTFLEVASVINQYALEAELSAGFSWNAFLPTDSQTLGGRGRYSDRPTITYNPLMGEAFTRSLMTPIPPDSLMSLIQAGWPVGFLFRVCVTAVNGIYNRTAARMFERLADPEFEFSFVYPILRFSFTACGQKDNECQGQVFVPRFMHSGNHAMNHKNNKKRFGTLKKFLTKAGKAGSSLPKGSKPSFAMLLNNVEGREGN